MTARAKAVINQGPTKIVHGDDPAINGLYNDSVLREVMLETMGPHTAPINAQVAVTMPHFADAVVRRKANPNYAPGAHVNGGWAGPCPVKRSEILASGQDGRVRSVQAVGAGPAHRLVGVPAGCSQEIPVLVVGARAPMPTVADAEHELPSERVVEEAGVVAASRRRPAFRPVPEDTAGRENYPAWVCSERKVASSPASRDVSVDAW